MSKYNDFEYIKTITNFNEVVDNDDDDDTYFHWICNYNSFDLEVIKYCIENGAGFNIKNYYCSTPFHFICYKNITKEVLEFCLENGADLNIKNNYGQTPFYWLHNNINIDILKCCLDKGANLNNKDEDNNTPFSWICEYNKDLSHYMGSGYNRIIKYCKPYMDEYDFYKTLKECNLNWKEYV